MKTVIWLKVLLALAIQPGIASAQERKKSEAEFVRSRPAIGDAIPDVVIYDSTGKEVRTSELRGHYTVLTFGCLT
jgi:hypothetical protein